MSEIIIRKAMLEDAAEIANVHINSWREAYKGLLPQDFLDQRPLYFKNRYELWKKVTVNPEQITYVAESSEHGVVGFINGKNGRDKDKEDWCEVWCIYLLEKFHGQKIGYQLLQKYFQTFSKKGFSKAYLWVLENNPTISFYERTGGVYSGQTKVEQIANQNVIEQMFCWDDLNI